MPRDSDKIDVRNSGFYRGTPTFAMKRGEKVPYLMYQLGANEKSIEEIRDIFGRYLDDESLGQGYVYKASGLTYGDMNSLMGDSSWFDDWDGYYSFYEYNNNLSSISPEVIFNIFDDKPLGKSPALYEQTYVNGSWGVELAERQELLGSDRTIANPQGYGMRHVIRADSLPRDSDLIMFQHPEYPMDMYGVPTFALGQYPPLLMNRREGNNQYSEEELVRMMGNYAKNLGYVYNPNGLTYGDVNTLMNKSKQFWDDWDGNYQLYLWDDDLKRQPWSDLGVVFNIKDDEMLNMGFKDGRNVVTAKSAETKEADKTNPTYIKPGQGVLVGGMKDGENVHYAHIIGVEEKDGFNPLYINYDPPVGTMRDALKKGHDFYENHAETKEASVGMIVRDGDPSSPPSDIFMAEDLPPSARDYQGPEHYELVLRKTSTPMSNGEYGFCLTKALTPRLDWMATRHSRPRLFMEDAMILNHRNENMNGLIYDDEIMTYRPMNAAEKKLYEGANNTGGSAFAWSVRLDEYTHFQAEDPTQADASNMGGPTAPGNAGVPADVGGDDLVPYDSPSAPPAGVFMNAEYKTYESKPVRNALFGVAFAVSGLYFWSTAGSVVKNWVVVRVEKYAPKLLEPQFQTMLTLTAFFGIIYFGMKLRGSAKGLTIPSMIDLSEASVDA